MLLIEQLCPGSHDHHVTKARPPVHHGVSSVALNTPLDMPRCVGLRERMSAYLHSRHDCISIRTTEPVRFLGQVVVAAAISSVSLNVLSLNEAFNPLFDVLRCWDKSARQLPCNLSYQGVVVQSLAGLH